MKRAVIDLTSTRPVWRIPASQVETIRRAFGSGWEVVHVTTPTSSDGDGAGPSERAVAAARRAEVYIGWGVAADVARAASGALRWAHTATAGVGGSLHDALRASGAVLTNSRHVHAEPMAEWVVAAIGFCVRGFHLAAAAQRERRWAKDDFTFGEAPLREFRDTRVGIVGLGGVGRGVARRCAALGMTVRGVRRRPAGRRPRGVRWVGGAGELGRLAAGSDVLVIAAPHTTQTDRLVDDAVLARLPRHAFVINVARGALLDERALLVHLDNGHLAGCVLDVFESEPLPPEHPLWHHPRALITPHVSAVSARFWERETALIVENVRRYKRGVRLKHIVDPAVGY